MNKTKNILKKTSRSIYLSIRILPKSVRPAFSIAYLLCRAADSIADTKLIEKPKRLKWISFFPDLIKHKEIRSVELKNLTEDANCTSELKDEKELISALPNIFSALDQMKDYEKTIIHDVLREVCAGMRMDLSFFKGDTADLITAFGNSAQLSAYCTYIGGGPGIFWTKMAVFNEFFKPGKGDIIKGRLIGEALQMTNILRDIASDLRTGRCYIPIEDISQLGLTPKDLLNYNSSEKLRPSINKWIKWVVNRLDYAQDYIADISTSRLGFKAATIWPVYWCLDTLIEIAKSRNILSEEKKIKINRSKIYSTLVKTPIFVLNYSSFKKGYCLRRDTLLSIVSNG